MITPIAIVTPHGDGYSVIVSGAAHVHLHKQELATAVAMLINGTCAGLAAQRNELRTALGQLRLEAMHYRDTHTSKQHLDDAIEAAGAVLVRGEVSP